MNDKERICRGLLTVLILAAGTISAANCCSVPAPAITTFKDAIDYLKRFGYMPVDNGDVSPRQSFVKFQQYFGLEPTGIFDQRTKMVMNKARCGNPDFEAGIIVKQMKSLSFKVDFTPQGCPEQVHQEWTAEMLNETFFEAIKLWKNKFPSLASSKPPHAEIGIKFSTGSYGAGTFDGRGGMLAYATPLQPVAGSNGNWHGNITFDDAELWSTDGEGPNLLEMSLHMLGHCLGLSHSNETSSVMYPLFKSRGKEAKQHPHGRTSSAKGSDVARLPKKPTAMHTVKRRAVRGSSGAIETEPSISKTGRRTAKWFWKLTKRDKRKKAKRKHRTTKDTTVKKITPKRNIVPKKKDGKLKKKNIYIAKKNALLQQAKRPSRTEVSKTKEITPKKTKPKKQTAKKNTAPQKAKSKQKYKNAKKSTVTGIVPKKTKGTMPKKTKGAMPKKTKGAMPKKNATANKNIGPKKGKPKKNNRQGMDSTTQTYAKKISSMQNAGPKKGKPKKKLYLTTLRPKEKATSKEVHDLHVPNTTTVRHSGDEPTMPTTRLPFTTYPVPPRYATTTGMGLVNTSRPDYAAEGECVVYFQYNGPPMSGINKLEKSTLENCKLDCGNSRFCLGFSFDNSRCQFMEIELEFNKKLNSYFKDSIGYGSLTYFENTLVRGGVPHVNYEFDPKTAKVATAKFITAVDCKALCREEELCIGITIWKKFNANRPWHCKFHYQNFQLSDGPNAIKYYIKHNVCD